MVGSCLAEDSANMLKFDRSNPMAMISLCLAKNLAMPMYSNDDLLPIIRPLDPTCTIQSLQKARVKWQKFIGALLPGGESLRSNSKRTYPSDKFLLAPIIKWVNSQINFFDIVSRTSEVFSFFFWSSQHFTYFSAIISLIYWTRLV